MQRHTRKLNNHVITIKPLNKSAALIYIDNNYCGRYSITDKRLNAIEDEYDLPHNTLACYIGFYAESDNFQ